jgi:hypothetical protein
MKEGYIMSGQKIQRDYTVAHCSRPLSKAAADYDTKRLVIFLRLHIIRATKLFFSTRAIGSSN